MATLVAKHPGAATASPAGFTLKVDNSPEGAAFRKAIDYGALDPVTLPKDAISRFEITGPPIVQSANEGELLWLVLRPVTEQDIPVPLTLALYDEDRGELGSHLGRVVASDRGRKGSVLRHEFYDGGFVIDWLIPDDQSTPGSAKVTLDLDESRTPSAVRGATDLALMLERSRSMRLLTARGEQVADVAGPTHMYEHDRRQHLTILREVADDLLFVQSKVGRQFVFPDEIDVMARINLRILRRLLEGRVVCWPEPFRLHLNVKPEALEDPKFRDLLRNPGQLVSTTDPDDDAPVTWTIDAVHDQGELATVSLPGAYGLYFPELVAENPDEVTEALTAGRVARLDLRSPSKMSPRLFMPSRLADDAQIVAEPWGLTDVPEVP